MEVWLSEKLETRVDIGNVYLRFPNYFEMENVFLQDQAGDTLLASRYLRINLDIPALLGNTIHFPEIHVDETHIHLSRAENDSLYNYQYLINSFNRNTAPKATPVDTTKKPWEIRISELFTGRVYFTMYDDYSNNRIYAATDTLFVEPAVLDFKRGLIAFDRLVASGTTVRIDLTPSDDPPSQTPDITTRILSLNDFSLDINSDEQGIDFEMRSDSLYADVNQFSIPREIVNLDHAHIQGTYVRIGKGNESNSPEGIKNPDLFMPLTWEISADQARLINDTLIIGNPTAGGSFNPASFRLDNLTALINDLKIDSSMMGGDIAELTGTLDNQVKVTQAEAEILADNRKLLFRDVSLRTLRSNVNGEAEIYQSSGNNPELSIALNNTRFPNQELLYFAPQLANMPFFANRSGITTINGTAEGTMERLDVDGQLGILTGTYADAHGTIGNLDQPDNLFLSLQIDRFKSTKTDLKTLIPAAKMNWPATIEAHGSLDGNLSSLLADLDIRSSYGSGSVDMLVDMAPSHTPSYKGTISLDNFDLGALMEQPDLGKATLTAQVDGRGFEPATMSTSFKAEIASLDYGGTVYKDVSAEGTIENEIFTGTVAGNAPGQNLAFSGSIGIGGKPVFDFTARVGNFDLGLFIPSLKGVIVQGSIDADISGNDFDNLTGDLTARDILFTKDGERYRIDSLYLNSSQENGITNIEIRSDIMSGTFTGGFSPGKLPVVLLAHFDQYFDIHTVDPPDQLDEQDFTFDINIYRGRLLALFIPGLENTGQGYLRGSFNSATDEMEVNAALRQLDFKRSYLDSVYTNLSSNSEQFTFDVSASRVKYQNLELYRPTLRGTATNNTIRSEFLIRSRDAGSRYAFQPVLSSIPATRLYELNLGGSDITLNFQNWTASPNHVIRFGENVFEINNLSLSYQDQSLTANTVDTSGLQVDFSRFRIETLTSITGNDSNMVTGLVNGFVRLTNFPEDLSFMADLSMADLAVMDAQIGNATLKASGVPGTEHQVDLVLSGVSDARISGTFHPVSQALNLTANLQMLNLSPLVALSNGEIKEINGVATGNLAITGTLTKPQVLGKINFPKAEFNLAFFNVPMYIYDQSITLDNNAIEMGEFIVLDSARNEMAVTGNIRHNGFTDMQFRLFASTDYFLLSNTSPGTNEFYYGHVVLSSNIIIRGTSALPVIRARLFLEEGTDINIILPSQQAPVANREGIVEYIDLESRIAAKAIDTVMAGIKGIDLEARLDIDESSKLRVIFNPLADDYLDVTGGGLLTYGIEPDGSINLTGKYVVEEGNYHFSLYDLVTRDFNILKGSNITWFGDPMTGQLDIQGVYQVRARARELLLTHGNPGTTYAYDERLPFQVNLDIQGELVLPEISFSLTLPPDERDAMGGAVYARIQQLNQNESELNKQVFSLIVFNHFMAEDPFSGPGVQGSALVRNSVSQILTQQLNNVTSQLLPGVELTFNLESYDTPGAGAAGQTELEVQLTKKLMNDRLLIQVGNDFDVSGNERQRTNQVNSLAADASVEYKLTEDGRYRFRAFRNTDFENYIIQQYVATGISLIFARDFDNFGNLFKKPEEIRAENDSIAEERSMDPASLKEEDEIPEPEEP